MAMQQHLVPSFVEEKLRRWIRVMAAGKEQIEEVPISSLDMFLQKHMINLQNCRSELVYDDLLLRCCRH